MTIVSPQALEEAITLYGFKLMESEMVPQDEIRLYTRDRWGVPRFSGAITNCLPEPSEFVPDLAPFRPEPPATATALGRATRCK